ncbi:hypothetical protein PQJ75_02395 [Rhodoplanes sp. TEM]|uniref:Uncharacterized protein n=1 Tax=Rhodoplanes tepidamans TaxID=200616 RepID=A0ABT5J613_RHOTP|nr:MULTISPECIES: hypothetical protein [Rhodoplanes]MDC7785098.1 hypothetical protein [Rhodoplanes tepidamans]MDC7982572.1 hypothetical protein [Rhodoplanes sp. TEM]MDQ0356587.1 hypothetical protein [Rhodoplanes tepidamans]
MGKDDVRLLPLALVLIGAVGSAWADCTNPPGQAGFVRYAANVSMMVFCDGTNWVSMSGGANVTVGGNVNNPGGADTYVQFNSGGTAFGGSSAFTWNTGTSTLSVTNISATNLSGLLQTAAQPNITSVGTLTGLTVNGTVSATTVSGTTGYFTNLVVNGVSVTGGAQADRIVSGSTKVVANSTTDIISLSTANVTWGYLASSTSYLPTLAGAKVSSTNASHNTVQLVPEPITNIMGGGGNYILSGTTAVSTSSAGTINFATNGNTQMTIDSAGNVGVGTSAPSTALDVSGTFIRKIYRASGVGPYIQSPGTVTGRTLTFTKMKNGTDILIRYADTLGAYRTSSLSTYCTFTIKVDGANCPTSIAGVVYYPGASDAVMSPSYIEGSCSGLSVGSHTISVASTTSTAMWCYAGYSPASWSLTAEEVY